MPSMLEVGEVRSMEKGNMILSPAGLYANFEPPPTWKGPNRIGVGFSRQNVSPLVCARAVSALQGDDSYWESVREPVKGNTSGRSLGSSGNLSRLESASKIRNLSITDREEETVLSEENTEENALAANKTLPKDDNSSAPTST